MAMPRRLAGVSYAWGGSVIFQYCNLPYLIGAAWLPWGVASVLGVIHGRSRLGRVGTGRRCWR